MVPAQYQGVVAHELTPDEIRSLPFVPRSLMRGAGIEPTFGARRPVAARPTRAGKDGEFWVEHSGLTYRHLHVLEALFASAIAAAQLTSGELSLRFRPGDVLRAMGLRNGNRGWLRAALKELGSPIGELPKALGGGDFAILRTMTVDIPSGRVYANAISGRDDEGDVVHEPVTAKIWCVRVSAGYQSWLASQASLRHDWLPQLRALKCAGAEAVARFALTGHCDRPLPDLLVQLGVIGADWAATTRSGAYQAARRAIGRVVALAPELAAMGVQIITGAGGSVRVIAQDRPDGVRFFKRPESPATNDESVPAITRRACRRTGDRRQASIGIQESRRPAQSPAPKRSRALAAHARLAARQRSQQPLAEFEVEELARRPKALE